MRKINKILLTGVILIIGILFFQFTPSTIQAACQPGVSVECCVNNTQNRCGGSASGALCSTSIQCGGAPCLPVTTQTCNTTSSYCDGISPSSACSLTSYSCMSRSGGTNSGWCFWQNPATSPPSGTPPSGGSCSGSCMGAAANCGAYGMDSASGSCSGGQLCCKPRSGGAPECSAAIAQGVWPAPGYGVNQPSGCKGIGDGSGGPYSCCQGLIWSGVGGGTCQCPATPQVCQVSSPGSVNISVGQTTRVPLTIQQEQGGSLQCYIYDLATATFSMPASEGGYSGGRPIWADVQGLTNGSGQLYFRCWIGGSRLCESYTTVNVSSAAPAPTLTFTATPLSIPNGGSTDLAWTSTNTTSCTATTSPSTPIWNGSPALSGTKNNNVLTQTTTFNLSCTGPGGTVSRSQTVTVAAAQPPTLTFTATPLNIPYNGSTDLAWTSTNATSCTATTSPSTPIWNGFPALSGTKNNNILTQTTTFNLSCTGPGGTVSRSQTVTVSAAPPPTLTFTASPTTITAGSNVTLNWTSTNTTSCTATTSPTHAYWNGSPALSGTQNVVNVPSTTIFNLSCTGPGGTVSRSQTVTVTSPAPTVTLIASPTTVNSGNTTNLSWSSTNATGCTASNGWTGSKAISGSQVSAGLTVTTIFTLTCTGPGGSASQSVTVTVNPPAAPFVDLTATPTVVASGGSSTLAWTTANVTSCTASGGWSGSKSATGGSQSSGAITAATTYTISCTGPGGTTTDSVTVSVSAPGVPTLTLTASPTTVNSGSSSTLTWSSSNTTTCTASGGWTGAKAVSGSQSSGAITATTSYFLSCTGPGGTVTQSVTVTVNAAPTLTLIATPTTVNSGSTTSLTWVSSGTTTCTASDGWTGTKATNGSQNSAAITAATTFTLTCTGPGGSIARSVTVTVAPPGAPTVTLAGNPPTVTSGGTTSLIWTSTNTTGCTASGGWSGSKAVTGSQVSGALTSNTTFTLSCTGPGGTATQSVTITVSAVAAPFVDLTANPGVVSSGGASTLAWTTANVTSCTASGGWSGSKSATGGSQSSGALTATTTYNISCTGPGGTITDAVTVSVSAAGVPSMTFIANPTTVNSGTASNLSWSSANVTSCTASGGWTGTKGVSGSQSTGALTATTSYFLGCTGPGGTVNQSQTVTVTTPGPGSCSIPTPDDPPLPACAPTASTTPVTFEWLPVAQATEYEIDIYTSAGTLVRDNTWATAGSFNCGLGMCRYIVNLGAGSYYSRVRARGVCTQSAFSNPSPIVTVTTCVAPTLTLTATPTLVTAPGTSTLSWTSTGTTTCTATGAWSGAKSLSGNEAQTGLMTTSTFTLNCTGPGGPISRSVTVTVNPPPTCSISLPNTINLVAGTTTPIAPTIISQQNGSISTIAYSVGNPSLVTVNPLSGSPATFSTNLIAIAAGTTTLSASAIMNGVPTCNATSNNVNIINPPAWFQAQEGGVLAGGSIASQIPATATNPVLIMGTQPLTGSAIYGSGGAGFGAGNVSQPRYLANTNYQGKRFDYAYFYSNVPSTVSGNASFTVPQNALTQGSLTSGGVLSNGYRWIHHVGDVTIGGGNIDLGSNRVVLFNEGNVTINSPINLTDGQGFFMIIGNRDITIGNTVGGGTTPNLEGLYVTDGTVHTGTAATSLLVRGTLIGLTGIDLRRDLAAGNVTDPAEKVVSALDQLLLYPSDLGRRQVTWQEVAP